MSTTTIHERLEAVFRQVFLDDELTLGDEITAADIPAWDSVAHINLMFAIEQAFGVRFAGNELAEMQDVGALKRWIERNGR